MGRPLRFKRTFPSRVDPLSHFTDTKFVQRYRLSKVVARILIANYILTLANPVPRGVRSIPHRIMFCIAIRYFATGANYSLIGDCHGVSKSTVSRAVKSVSNYFRAHYHEYIQWPDKTYQKQNNAMIFLQKKKKPGCFGLIDGTHIPIACPRGIVTDENQFYCYKGYYSINAMIVSDYHGIIFHVNASCPGSCNDIYVMNGSRIKHYGERADFSGFYLLGDSGYVLTDYLLIPIRVEETNADARYNKWHKSTRSSVERTIGVLKQRWRCLDTSGGHLMHSPHRASCIIESCVALHNCAKLGKVKLLRDFCSRDGFRRVQPRVEQPDNHGQKPVQHFANMRKEFIDQWFSG